MKQPLIAAMVCAACICSQERARAGTTNFLNETPEQKRERMEWFEEARFGMFIHWGVYSVPAGEYQGNKNYGEWFLEETKMPVSQYQKYASEFNPVKFNAKAWARMAKQAGMKYLVITSKHHDGFAIYPSELTDWCMKATPFKRDPLKELAEACRKEGIRFSTYHSIMDWYHPDWGLRRPWNDKAPSTAPDMDRYVVFLKGQLAEIVSRYRPGIMWFDGEWESPWNNQRGRDLYNYVRSLDPKIIINNRVGKGRAGMGGMDEREGVGDYGTPEQEIPATGFGPGVYWESCMTMNNHWGYNRADQNWKSTTTLVRNLIDCASKGGNYLLNVGPTAEGEFPQASIQRLAEIGEWMKVNKDAIYETTASPFKTLPWGRATKRELRDKGTMLYLHVFDWPSDGKLHVPGLKAEVTRSLVLTAKGDQKVESARTDDGLVVTLPAKAQGSHSTTVALRLKPGWSVERTYINPGANGTVLLPAASAEVSGHGPRFEAGENRNSIGFWLNPAETVSWQLKVGQTGKYAARAEIASTGESGFEVIVAPGGNTSKAGVKIPNTGDYGKFQTVEIGVLEVQAGITRLTVKPDAQRWSPVNLRSVTLTPVK